MSTTSPERIAALNPLTDDDAARLPLNAAESELLAEICAAATPRSVRSSQPARRRLGLMIGLPAAAAVVLLAVLAALPSGRGSDAGGPPPAFGAELVRFANASPLILLQAPRWRAFYADENSPQSGEIDFQRADYSLHTGRPVGAAAGLTWQPRRTAGQYIQDRAAEASVKTTIRLLGVTAHRFEYAGGTPGDHAFTAIWTSGSRVLLFSGRAGNLAAFTAELGLLHHVDPATWLRALPANVIKTADRGETIRQMLRGIPLPPGFDARQIPGAELVRDRYQLGAAVTGTVACEWFARWSRARRAGDHAQVSRAIAALATAPGWPILREMSRQGDWSQILIGYTRAMRAGRLDGQPLAGMVNGTLGCARQWHVRL